MTSEMSDVRRFVVDETAEERATAADLRISLVVRGAVLEEVTKAIEGRMLSADEMLWIRLAIKREGQRVQFQKAIIEKTALALIFSFFVAVTSGIYMLLYKFLESHGWKAP